MTKFLNSLKEKEIKIEIECDGKLMDVLEKREIFMDELNFEEIA